MSTPNDTVTSPDTTTVPADEQAAASSNVVPLRRNPAPAEPAEVEVLEGELVADTVAVDQPEPAKPAIWEGFRSADRRPLIAPWLRSWETFRSTVAFTCRHYLHTAAYHALRVPLYALHLLSRAPRGLGKVLRGWWRWLADAEAKPLRLAAVHAADAQTYLRLSAQRNTRVGTRLLVTGAALAAVFIGWFLLPGDAPLWTRWEIWGLTLAALLGLGVAGSPADKPIATRAVVSTQVAKLTSEVIVRALTVLGLGGITSALSKNPNAITFAAPITRDGPGWRADIDLPPGVTATEVADKRAKLASGLGRPLGCVWPEGNPAVHPGRLVLWVGDQDMSKARQPVWPLHKATQIDLFKPQPFGTDQRGQWVNVTLMFISGIIGAVPRMGKTFTLRELLLIAALDPRAELHPYDLKGTGDLAPLGPVSHRYRAGDDPEDIDYALVDLRALREEMRRRTKVIRELPRDLCPESKVTPELANNKKLGLHPIVIGVDECQVWFEHPDHGKEIEEICTDLAKRGPATGIVLLLATQRPDSKSIPTQISDNAIWRFCLKVAGQVPNDMVLGTSSYQNGQRATTFAFSDKGIGILKGDGDEPKTTRGVYIDAPGADKIAARARAARVVAGRLSGYAAGLDIEVEDQESSSLLEDLTAVFGEADKVWSEALVDRLAELRPAAYGPWGELPTGAAKATQLATALKPFGITTKQVWITEAETGKGANRMGLHRDWITKALTERN
ncbi:DUF3631 domain-containing protein [Crossiella sp. CA198]|uniref:DUF3631 domain-containing protein n=1 Tax=Crossiella sp. CA198 TaxID=3455607 RepID=UPI003F8D8AD6